MEASILFILAALVMKHLLVDFIMQTPFMYRNKHIYMHMGGLAHAAEHTMFTVMIFAMFGWIAIVAGLLDFVIHYHMDWIKMKVTANKGYSSYNEDGTLNVTSENYFFWLGIDQTVHSLTYIGLVALLLI